MDFEMTRQDIRELLRDTHFMRGILTEVTKHVDVQKELAEHLAEELSDRLGHYRQIGRLLQDEQALSELIQQQALGDGHAEEVADGTETTPDIQAVTRKLSSTSTAPSSTNGIRSAVGKQSFSPSACVA